MAMHAQVFKLMTIRALRAFMIAIPVIVIYWQSHGLAVRDIFVLQVIFSIALVLFEIPSGYFADWFGKKASVVLGTLTGTAGFFLYWAIPSYAGFVAAELVLALSVGFMSGASSALMFETLLEHKQESLFKKFQGRLLALGTSSEAVAAVLAGVVASQFSIEAVLMIQWIVIALAVPVALSLHEAAVESRAPTPPLLKIVQGSLRENERLRYLHLFAGAINAATLTMVWFTQPHWKSLGVDILYFGYLWALLNLTTAFGAVAAHRLEPLLRFRTLFGVMAMLPFVLYGLMSLTSTTLLALAVVPFFWLLRGVKTPIVEDYVSRECANGERATTLSINALASRLIFSIFSPFLGWIVDLWSFEVAFLAAGLVFGALSLTGFLFLYAAMQRAHRT